MKLLRNLPEQITCSVYPINCMMGGRNAALTSEVQRAKGKRHIRQNTVKCSAIQAIRQPHCKSLKVASGPLWAVHRLQQRQVLHDMEPHAKKGLELFSHAKQGQKRLAAIPIHSDNTSWPQAPGISLCSNFPANRLDRRRALTERHYIQSGKPSVEKRYLRIRSAKSSISSVSEVPKHRIKMFASHSELISSQISRLELQYLNTSKNLPRGEAPLAQAS